MIGNAGEILVIFFWEQCGTRFCAVAADTIVAIINLEICIFINSEAVAAAGLRYHHRSAIAAAAAAAAARAFFFFFFFID